LRDIVEALHYNRTQSPWNLRHHIPINVEELKRIKLEKGSQAVVDESLEGTRNSSGVHQEERLTVAFRAYVLFQGLFTYKSNCVVGFPFVVL
jgi:hypothetical protein